MALYSRQIENYIGGVSQQAYNLRYPNQFNEQINCVSSVVNGLIKRPPAEFLTSRILEGDFKVKTHRFSVGAADNENFLINITQNLATNDISCFITDLEGNSKTFSDPNNVLDGYLGVGNNIDNFKFLSLLDTTFIVNPNVTVEKLGATTPARPLKAMVFVKQTDFGKTFKINVAGTEVSFTTPDGSDASDSLQVGTDFVATQLSTELTNAGKTNTIIGGNVIVIDLVTENDVLEVSDGLGGRGLIPIKSTISRFEDLPSQSLEGFVVKVINTDELDADDYYVVFETDGSGSAGSGSWVETIAPNVEFALNQNTMPVALKYNGNSFSFTYEVWDEKKAGDDETNPFPSFVGQKINDITTFQDRLVFTTDSFVVMSETSNFFNFFRNTVLILEDSAVIDIGVNSYDSYRLHSAIPWSELLVLFSREKQFILRSSGSSLTPKTISIVEAGSYESNENIRPKGAGSNLLFGATNGDNSNIYEMFVSNYENVDARNTTSHVSNYIPKNIKALEVLSVYNMAVMLSKEDTKSLYIYQYLFNGSEKVQNAYHKWTFDFDEIYDIKFSDNDLYITCKIQDKVCIMSLEINDIQKDEGLNYKIHLDKRLTESDISMTYDALRDETQVNLPLQFTDPLFVTREFTENNAQGYILTPKSILGNQITFDGNITQESFYVGQKYLQYLEHSTMTSVNPQTGNVDTSGLVKILKHTITFDMTGYFEAKVSRKTGSDMVTKYYSKVLNDYGFDFREYEVKSGTFAYSVKGTNTEVKLSISNDSHLPCNIQSSEYDYRFYKNTR